MRLTGPSLEMGNAEAPSRGNDAPHLSELDTIYAELVELAVRYLQLLTTTKGLDRLLIRQVLQEGLNRTIEHTLEVGDKIAQLGGVPAVDLTLHVRGERCPASDAIRTALAFEQGVLDGFRDIQDRGCDNPILDEFTKRQITRQSERVSELYMLLEA